MQIGNFLFKLVDQYTEESIIRTPFPFHNQPSQYRRKKKKKKMKKTHRSRSQAETSKASDHQIFPQRKGEKLILLISIKELKGYYFSKDDSRKTKNQERKISPKHRQAHHEKEKKAYIFVIYK